MIYLYLLPLSMAGRKGWIVPWNRAAKVRGPVAHSAEGTPGEGVEDGALPLLHG